MEKEANQASEKHQASPVEEFVLDENIDQGVQKTATPTGAIARDTPSKSASRSVHMDSEPQTVLAIALPDTAERMNTNPPSRPASLENAKKSFDTKEKNRSSDSGRNAGAATPDTAKPIRRSAWLPKSASSESKTPDQLARIGPEPIKLSDEATAMKHAIEIIMLKKIEQRRDAEAHFRCLIVIANEKSRKGHGPDALLQRGYEDAGHLRHLPRFAHCEVAAMCRPHPPFRIPLTWSAPFLPASWRRRSGLCSTCAPRLSRSCSTGEGPALRRDGRGRRG
jgi:hypothetical protein